MSIPHTDFFSTLLDTPVEPDQLLAAVHSLLGADSVDSDKRRWPRTRVSQELELVMTQGAARMVDVSYGGCRLHFRPGTKVSLSHTLDLPIATDVPITGTPVWKTSARDGDDYGVAIGRSAQEAEAAWRAFVDELRRRA